MTAASAHKNGSPTEVDTPCPTASPASDAISASTPVHLDEARDCLLASAEALDGWRTRQSSAGRSYVADGHEAIRLIDAADGELQRVRNAVVGEIRADEDDRAARVDRMIAEFRGRPTGNVRARLDSAVGRDGGSA